MIVDTSALMVLLLEEPEQAQFTMIMQSADSLRISAGNLLELTAVSTRRFDGKIDASIELLLREIRLIVEPVTVEQAAIAREAYRAFGKGTGHPAGLNFGDCFAYALAKATGEALLFKGDDFSRTDIVPVPGR